MGFQQRRAPGPPPFSSAASPDITIALTGVTSTGAVGLLGVAFAIALTGLAGTGAVGTVTPNFSLPITTVLGTGAVGSLTQSFSVPLVSTGVVATSAVGTLTPGMTFALASPGMTGAVGALTPSFTSALTGVTATGGLGTLSPGFTLALSGNGSTGALGTLGVNCLLALTGVAGTSALGTVAPVFSIPLVGVAGTGSVGSVTVLGGGGGPLTLALTGVGATGALGVLAPVFTLPLPMAANAYSDGVLALAPIAYYRLNDAASPYTDSISGNNGVATGSVIALQPGIDGDKAVIGDNSSAPAYITVATNAALTALVGTRAVSQELWLNIDPARIAGFDPDQEIETFVLNWLRPGHNAYGGIKVVYLPASWFVDGSAPAWGVQVNVDATQTDLTTAPNTFDYANNKPYVAIMPGHWYHVVATYDGLTAKLYVNGVFVNQADVNYWAFPPYPDAHSGEIGAGADGFVLGKYIDPSTGTNLDFGGSIDEVAIYNTVLTPAQIATNYRNRPATLDGALGNLGVGSAGGGGTAPTIILVGDRLALHLTGMFYEFLD